MISEYSLEQSFNRCVQILVDCFSKGNKLLLCGNGGSAADCGHIQGELVKGFTLRRPMDESFIKAVGEPWAEKLQQGLPAIDLTANGPLISAIANDIDPISAYAQQVTAYGKKGDAILGLSTSGNAENVLRALKAAKALGLTTIGLTGKGGGKMAEFCDILLAVDEEETYMVQQGHLALYHKLCMKIEHALFKQ